MHTYACMCSHMFEKRFHLSSLQVYQNTWKETRIRFCFVYKAVHSIAVQRQPFSVFEFPNYEELSKLNVFIIKQKTYLGREYVIKMTRISSD